MCGRVGHARARLHSSSVYGQKRTLTPTDTHSLTHAHTHTHTHNTHTGTMKALSGDPREGKEKKHRKDANELSADSKIDELFASAGNRFN